MEEMLIKSAVPSMLHITPIGTTKRDTLVSILSSSKHFKVTGRAALLVLKNDKIKIKCYKCQFIKNIEFNGQLKSITMNPQQIQ